MFEKVTQSMFDTENCLKRQSLKSMLEITMSEMLQCLSYSLYQCLLLHDDACKSLAFYYLVYNL